MGLMLQKVESPWSMGEGGKLSQTYSHKYLLAKNRQSILKRAISDLWGEPEELQQQNTKITLPTIHLHA